MLPLLLISSCSYREPEVYSFNFSDRLPILDANIEGETVNVLFDTGAENNKIDAESKHVPLAKLTGITGKCANADNKIFITQECILPKISLQNHVFESLEGVICETIGCSRTFGEAELKEDLKFDLTLGRDFYNEGLLLIDYPSKKIIKANELAEIERLGYETKDWISTQMYYSKWGIHLVVEEEDGSRMSVLTLDTGTNDNILLHFPGLGPYDKTKFCEIKITTPIYTGGEIFDPGRFAIYDDLDFGENVDGILGYTFFQKHLVLFDFHNYTILIKSVEDR